MKMILLIFGSLLFVAACGDSHRVNDDPLESRTQRVDEECQMYFESEGLCLRARWQTMPTEDTFGSMILTFTEKNSPSRPVSPKRDPFIQLWMPSMGHGSSPVTITPLDEGVYRAEDIFFIMPGPWDIRYQLKDDSSVIEEKIQKITIKLSETTHHSTGQICHGQDTRFHSSTTRVFTHKRRCETNLIHSTSQAMIHSHGV